MIAAERLGASEAKLLRYANSGDTTDDRSRVVGYGALALMRGAADATSNDQAFSLTRQEKDTLLEMARKSVETAVRRHRLAECPRPAASTLNQERGAFVTITKNGQLRGCIGYVAPVKPLYLTVCDVAAKAALEDSRFPPVKPAELADLEYEVSVLSPLRRVQDVREIRVGQHGLLIHAYGLEGLLLPQVATEEKLDRIAFLELASRKAGLPEDAWLRPETDIFRFTALVFAEHNRVQTFIPPDVAWRAVPWRVPPAPGQLSPSVEQSLEIQTLGSGRH
jgi:AmmeMemoRadiSam system protein A